MKFVDYVKIYIESGAGGRGSVSFRREKYIPKGGPDGGDGGRGGNIIIKAYPQLYTLLDQRYKKTYIAKRGRHGMGKKMHGSNGEDVIIRVPAGTVVKDASTGEVIADLDIPSEELLAAKGGIGGFGNTHFATSTRQAPRFAQEGMPGESRDIILELKLIADIGLIGLPNAGKSTLLSSITSAKPKIADYPFTTLTPNLGVVKTGNYKSFVVADIPGLIENAHMGTGLGFQFLRHVERTKILLHLVDVSEMTKGEPVANLEKINRELKLYSPELSDKPQIIAATKVDIASEEKIKMIREYSRIKNTAFFEISALTGKGVKDLTYHMSQELEKIRTAGSDNTGST